MSNATPPRDTLSVQAANAQGLSYGETRKGIDRVKPPYRIPTMAEIKRTRLNGARVVSLFSGCGGSSLGYRMAG